MKRKSLLIKIGIAALIIFAAMNIIAAIHAYKFTHFSTSGEVSAPKDNRTMDVKIKMLFTGIDLARPENDRLPETPYEVVHFDSYNHKLEGWYIPADSAIGTVIMFHGYIGNKSQLVKKAHILNQMKYNTLLIDFMGSGGSEGNHTSIGYYEAVQVKDAYDYLQANYPDDNLYLFGNSMGAAAIMKAMKDYDDLKPQALLLECPFGTMEETVNARFRSTRVPTFPMSKILLFWGGFINDYNSFKHNPADYAKEITTPTLLMYGENDVRVTQREIDQIYINLAGPKTKKIIPGSGHNIYVFEHEKEWTENMQLFLK
ncbi:alpha/beta hydrolase [Fulvivirga ligni]|uniref:alpha/beta hydrolase n=1 Tax=Fulvivirga ligni TaxID=2904246 RepID=UPI001F2FC5F6|nr:alpha/beta fold hydrolase [Fulvivirga ligni]UII19143.1 lysophospholipase [Fulvivirga ligni]